MSIREYHVHNEVVLAWIIYRFSRKFSKIVMLRELKLKLQWVILYLWTSLKVDHPQVASKEYLQTVKLTSDIKLLCVSIHFISFHLIKKIDCGRFGGWTFDVSRVSFSAFFRTITAIFMHMLLFLFSSLFHFHLNMLIPIMISTSQQRKKLFFACKSFAVRCLWAAFGSDSRMFTKAFKSKRVKSLSKQTLLECKKSFDVTVNNRTLNTFETKRL